MTAFIDPVTGFTITQGFSATHDGLDMAVPVGTPVHDSHGGIIVHTGDDPGIGLNVHVKNPDGYECIYGHLSRLTTHDGQLSHQGDIIGYSGGQPGTYGAGSATGPHLHFGIKQNGQFVNPAPLLGNPHIPNTSGINPASSNPFAALGTIGATLSSKQFWVRAGIMGIGVVLLIIALTKILATSQTGRTIINTTKTAATAALL